MASPLDTWKERRKMLPQNARERFLLEWFFHSHFPTITIQHPEQYARNNMELFKSVVFILDALFKGDGHPNIVSTDWKILEEYYQLRLRAISWHIRTGGKGDKSESIKEAEKAKPQFKFTNGHPAPKISESELQKPLVSSDGTKVWNIAKEMWEAHAGLAVPPVPGLSEPSGVPESGSSQSLATGSYDSHFSEGLNLEFWSDDGRALTQTPSTLHGPMENHDPFKALQLSLKPEPQAHQSLLGSAAPLLTQPISLPRTPQIYPSQPPSATDTNHVQPPSQQSAFLSRKRKANSDEVDLGDASILPGISSSQRRIKTRKLNHVDSGSESQPTSVESAPVADFGWVEHGSYIAAPVQALGAVLDQPPPLNVDPGLLWNHQPASGSNTHPGLGDWAIPNSVIDPNITSGWYHPSLAGLSSGTSQQFALGFTTNNGGPAPFQPGTDPHYPFPAYAGSGYPLNMNMQSRQRLGARQPYDPLVEKFIEGSKPVAWTLAALSQTWCFTFPPWDKLLELAQSEEQWLAWISS
ncbi:hypothetical protein DFP72DRAFT_1067218 [Ephemerocybe angulata]|uniref:Uncharacterized protein n=1 Tax=Ephemerocybe angulata TaxID=980116 RepID=A0A8H6I1W8_9AGAR|nr:hypothetical protein DFP72DRAFT_1067218 [Tulosesus angulatus]